MLIFKYKSRNTFLIMGTSIGGTNNSTTFLELTTFIINSHVSKYSLTPYCLLNLTETYMLHFSPRLRKSKNTLSACATGGANRRTDIERFSYLP